MGQKLLQPTTMLPFPGLQKIVSTPYETRIDYTHCCLHFGKQLNTTKGIRIGRLFR